jgi:hypothetical protein
VKIELTPSLIDAIERYNTTPWHDGRDPSKLGALNAVAYIGEQVAGLVRAAQARLVEVCGSCGRTRAQHIQDRPRHRFRLAGEPFEVES